MIPSRLVGPLLLLLLLARAAPTAAASEELDTREQNLEQVERKLQRLKQDLVGRRTERSQLLVELERTERHIGDLARADRQLGSMIEAQQRIAEDLDGRAELQKDALQAQQQILGQLLRAAYTMGHSEVFRLLMSQDEVRHFGRLTAYYGYFSEERARRVAEVGKRREALQALAEQARQEKQRLSMLAQRQEKTRLRLEASHRMRNAVLTKLVATISSREDRLATLEEDALALRAVIEQLRRSAQILDESGIQQGSIAEQRGRLKWPTETARLLTRFGTRKDDSEVRLDGVLLAAGRGEAVQAVYHGRVVFADWLRGFGLLIIVDHGDGYMSLYGHNHALLKETGEWVASGDQLALSGASGGQREPGVYFALRRNGEPMNPEQWCRL